MLLWLILLWSLYFDVNHFANLWGEVPNFSIHEWGWAQVVIQTFQHCAGWEIQRWHLRNTLPWPQAFLRQSFCWAEWWGQPSGPRSTLSLTCIRGYSQRPGRKPQFGHTTYSKATRKPFHSELPFARFELRNKKWEDGRQALATSYQNHLV